MPLTPGTRLGPYEVKSLLGAGGMAAVVTFFLGGMVWAATLPEPANSRVLFLVSLGGILTWVMLVYGTIRRTREVQAGSVLLATGQLDNAEVWLKRALGQFNLTALGIGAIIGAGIFLLTGQEAAKYAGPAIVYSFILAGIACAFAGLCYSEFSAMIPISGSAYTYGYATMGEFIAWIIGWDLILEYLFAASTVAVGWSGYVVSFLKDVGIHIPPAFTSAPYNHITPTDAGWNVWRLFTEAWVSTGAVLNVPAMVIVALITILLVIGITESANFNNVIVAIKSGAGRSGYLSTCC